MKLNINELHFCFDINTVYILSPLANNKDNKLIESKKEWGGYEEEQ